MDRDSQGSLRSSDLPAFSRRLAKTGVRCDTGLDRFRNSKFGLRHPLLVFGNKLWTACEYVLFEKRLDWVELSHQ
jgi:hypothetical protein